MIESEGGNRAPPPPDKLSHVTPAAEKSIQGRAEQRGELSDRFTDRARETTERRMSGPRATFNLMEEATPRTHWPPSKPMIALTSGSQSAASLTSSWNRAHAIAGSLLGPWGARRAARTICSPSCMRVS